MAWIANLSALYTSSYARDYNPRARFINLYARYNNPCAWYNNSWARYNNRNHEILIRLHDIIIRAHELINWALDLINRSSGIRIHALEKINRSHEIIIRFHDIIIWANKWTIYVNWMVYSSDSITKEPNSPEFMYSCINMYLLETGKAPCWIKRFQARQITFVYTIIVEGHQKQFLPKQLWILLNNLIGLSYMTTRRSPVWQSREEDKDQELIHDAARHCSV